MNHPSLKYRTMELVRNCGLSDRDFSRQFGVSLSWKRCFLDGTTKSPNVDLVQRIYEGLSGQPLFKDDR